MDRFAGLAAKLRTLWFGRRDLGRRTIVIGAAALLFIGLAVVGATRAALRVGPTSTGGAPPSQATADPPATETSSRTVVEDDPVGPAQPPDQLASLPLAAEPSPRGPARGRPSWERFALPAVDAGGRPMIAVIIDDMGLDKRRTERILQLPGPLTVSFMSYAEELGRQTDEARARGHELMMHVPMEPLAEGLDAGPGALLVTLSIEELRKRVDADLDRFHGYVGINNHMGSKFTAYAPGMQVVMDELRRRGLLFIDSLTTEHSVGLSLAQQSGVPTAARNVFLDNAGDIMAVDGQLEKLEEVARKKGNAIAIGHPRDATIAGLAAWLPTLGAKGLVLVPVSEVVRARRTAVAPGPKP